MTEVFVGLGSNIHRYHHIASALDALQARFSSLRISPVYEAEAVGFVGDPFLNLVVGFDCELTPAELLVFLRQLELQHGRAANAVKFSARTLDIDILLFGDCCGEQLEGVSLPANLNLPSLVLPRAEILENAYVLKPLVDLAAEQCHPQSGRRFADHWQEMLLASPLCADQLYPVDFRWQGALISRA
ncbi:2-amino-4-hydroxy-6-hydroxymethyldihydropteridine diphosphokinase [Spongiibacter sp. KMU-158]|uniref:2-amino-4-hydroxy-6-hydroxymethyldihydropteridine diphosphokinase n=1 Tax=Spongiibacter pelagi TaxID=2760804 RepID=A0A927BZT3_9GAMM|nr:2-amino-4-hydroxy-6-hydroxymethyldihydropteridine diphosphokinase [Spongiibacter pelagi]MBD2858615.1 2-amino-4-hydroxy-6-hydroxymethyldihydropteridine diphosphokinase [Spongiibacter pelagi]